MKLKQISIKRQPDDTFAVVAKIEYSSGSTAEVILKKGKENAKPSDLKEDLVFFLTDEESLQAEIQFHLTQVG